MVQPTKLFWKAVKHVLRYLRGTSQFGLWYRQTEEVKLQGFTDVDWAGSSSDWKSTSGGILNLGLVVPGTTGNRGEFHLAQQRLNTWLLVRLHVRPFGYRRF